MKKLLLTLLVAVLAMPVFAQTTYSFASGSFGVVQPQASSGYFDKMVTPDEGNGESVVYTSGFFNSTNDGESANLPYMSAGLSDSESYAYVTIAQYLANVPNKDLIKTLTINFAKYNANSVEGAYLHIYPGSGKPQGDESAYSMSIELEDVVANQDGTASLNVDLSESFQDLSTNSTYFYVLEFILGATAENNGAIAINNIVVVNYVVPKVTFTWNTNFLEEVSLKVGETSTRNRITKTTPSSQFSKVRYYAEKEGIVEVVSNTGKITAKSVGETNIYAALTYDGVEYKSSSYKVTVTPATFTTFRWNNSSATITYNSDTLTPGDGSYPAFVATTSNGEQAPITYSLSTTIKGVNINSETGVITLVQGEFNPPSTGVNFSVIAEVADSNYEHRSATTSLTIVPAIAWATSTPLTVAMGKTLAMPAVNFNNGATGDVTYSVAEGSEGVISINDANVITPLSVGTATIQATLGSTVITRDITVTAGTLSLKWDNQHPDFYFASTSFAITGDNALMKLVDLPKGVDVVYSVVGRSGATIAENNGDWTVTLPTTLQPSSNASQPTEVTIRAAVEGGNYNATYVDAIVHVLPTIVWPEGTNASYSVAYGATDLGLPVAELYSGYESESAIAYTATPAGIISYNGNTPTLTGVGGPVTVTATLGATKITYKLTVTKGTVSLNWVGNPTSIEAVYGGANNVYPTLNNPSAVGVAYTSSNPAAATIAADGTITLVGAGTTIISAQVANTDLYNALNPAPSYTLVVSENLNAGSINWNFNNTTTAFNNESASLAGTTTKLAVSSSGITRGVGVFNVANGATITFGPSAFRYKELKVAGVADGTYDVKVTVVGDDNALITQEFESQSFGQAYDDYIPQALAYYTIKFNQECTIDGIVFKTVTGALPTNNVQLNAVVATAVDKDNKVTLSSTAITAASYTPAAIFDGGQNIRLYFTGVGSDVVYFAFGSPSSLIAPDDDETIYHGAWRVQTGEEVFSVTNGKPDFNYAGNLNPSDFSGNPADAKENMEAFTAYVPGTLLDLQANNTNLYYLVKSDSGLSAVRQVAFSGITGIEDIVADEETGEAVYYNLQGVKIANPVRGQVYVRVIGKKADKVVF